MTHFAYVKDNRVEKVIPAEQEHIDSLPPGPGRWIQTSYNTRGGVHLLGGTPLRKNFAGIGFSYDPDLDAFIPPRQHSSWQLNTDTGLWEAPVSYPTDGQIYVWSDTENNWVIGIRG